MSVSQRNSKLLAFQLSFYLYFVTTVKQQLVSLLFVLSLFHYHSVIVTR